LLFSCQRQAAWLLPFSLIRLSFAPFVFYGDDSSRFVPRLKPGASLSGSSPHHLYGCKIGGVFWSDKHNEPENLNQLEALLMPNSVSIEIFFQTEHSFAM
jgi:hypothetical protein